jgi:DNA modification methylase
MIELDKIYLGDCLDIMPHIADKSVDMILCDLPYQVLHKNNPNAQWDRIIPFESLWEQYNRIIKDNGAIVLFAQGMFTAQLMMSNPKIWRYNLVWDKVLKTGFLNSKKMPLRQHEDICVFYKSLPTYNPQMVKCEPHKRNHSKGNGEHRLVNRCYGSYVETPTIISDEKFPTSIIREPKQHIKGKSYHPTEKPVKLLQNLIRTYTNEGDTVLDNTMGSGSTIVAAIKENRRYIGIEKDEHFFEIAKQRIENELQQPKSLF